MFNHLDPCTLGDLLAATASVSHDQRVHATSPLLAISTKELRAQYLDLSFLSPSSLLGQRSLLMMRSRNKHLRCSRRLS